MPFLFSREKYPDLPHVRYTDDICEFNRGTPVEPKKKVNGHIPNSEEGEKGEPVTDNEEDFDKLSSVMDETEQNKIIDEILEENESEIENQTIPSDVDETTHSDIDTAPNNTNEDIMEPDNVEDPLIESNEVKTNEDVEEMEVADRLEPEVNNANEVLEGNTQDEDIDTETNNEAENDIPSINENGEENDSVVNTTAPTSDFIEEDANKSEEDNVVDGIVGDFDESTNER